MMPDMKIHRTRASIFILTVALLAVGLAACGSAPQSDTPFANEDVATLSPLRQLVEIKRGGSEDWEPVHGAVTVADGDRVRTSVGGVALLVFSEGTSTEVHPDTILIIDHVGNNGNRLIVEISQLSGRLLNRIQGERSSRVRHTLHTEAASVEVRGTVYWSSVENDDSAKFQPTEGGLQITPADADDPVTLDAVGCLIFRPGNSSGEDCSGEPAPEPLTLGEPFLRVAELNGPVDLSGCGDGTCNASVGENRFSCRPDCNLASCGNLICEPEERATTCEQDCVRLDGAICGDGVCQADSGEDFINCQADCQPPPLFCGDGICSDLNGEDITSCAADCAPLGFCGDGTCNPDTGEDKFTCSVDCGLPGFCGDDRCQKALDESPFSCPDDCPASLYCGNNVCDQLLDEKNTCPEDCQKKKKPCGDGVCDPDQDEDADTCPADCAATIPPEPCGDGVCDPDAGEDETTCTVDCALPGRPCGDGVCSADDGEDETTCPADCAPPPDGTCGDGVCDPDAGEDEITCTADCVLPGGPCGDGVCSADDGEDETTCPADCASPPAGSCGDGVCDPSAGEDELTCAADCAPPPAGSCGDAVCDPGEDVATCPADCTADPCGDGVCDPASGEDENTCAADCSPPEGQSEDPPPPDPCGDGVCDPDDGEDTDTCPEDCAASSAPPDPCGDGVCDPLAGEDDQTCPDDCAVSAGMPGHRIALACTLPLEENICRMPMTTASRPAARIAALVIDLIRVI